MFCWVFPFFLGKKEGVESHQRLKTALVHQKNFLRRRWPRASVAMHWFSSSSGSTGSSTEGATAGTAASGVPGKGRRSGEVGREVWCF